MKSETFKTIILIGSIIWILILLFYPFKEEETKTHPTIYVCKKGIRTSYITPQKYDEMFASGELKKDVFYFILEE